MAHVLEDMVYMSDVSMINSDFVFKLQLTIVGIP